MTENHPNLDPAAPDVQFTAKDAQFIADTNGLLVKTAQALPISDSRHETEVHRIISNRQGYVNSLRESNEPSADSVHLLLFSEAVGAMHSREGTMSAGKELRSNPLLTEEERKDFFETASTLWSHRHAGIAYRARTDALVKHVQYKLSQPEASPALRLAYLGLAFGATIEQPVEQISDPLAKEVALRTSDVEMEGNLSQADSVPKAAGQVAVEALSKDTKEADEGGNDTGISETFRANAEALNPRAISFALKNDSLTTREVEGRRLFTRAIVIFVNKHSGRISGIGSYEQVERQKNLHPNGTEKATIEAAATGLPKAILESPDTSRVYAWFDQAGLPTEGDDGKLHMQRPDSWLRNDQIRLSVQAQRRYPIEEAIPEPIERGVFLKSIDNYNTQPQSDVFVPPAPRNVAK